MSYAADWMVVTGFMLAVLSVVLRTVMMMQASDAQPAGVAAKEGRELLRSYHNKFPKSRLPIAMWIALGVGLIMLIAGVVLVLR